MKAPIFILNLKTYSEGSGERALEIAKILESTSKELGVHAAIAVQSGDIYRISQEVEIPVFSQHISPITYGSHTGHILPETVKFNGAEGTLINHSEHRLDLADIDLCIKRARECSLEQVVCTNTVEVSAAVSALAPTALAIEPPELIGGNISVSAARPEVITGSLERVRAINKDVKVLCGAGVKNKQDVKKAIQLGSQGILIASGIVKASDIKKACYDLLGGF